MRIDSLTPDLSNNRPFYGQICTGQPCKQSRPDTHTEYPVLWDTIWSILPTCRCMSRCMCSRVHFETINKQIICWTRTLKSNFSTHYKKIPLNNALHHGSKTNIYKKSSIYIYLYILYSIYVVWVHALARPDAVSPQTSMHKRAH